MCMYERIYKCQFLYFDIPKVDNVFIKKWNHMVPLKNVYKIFIFLLIKRAFLSVFFFLIFTIRF